MALFRVVKKGYMQPKGERQPRIVHVDEEFEYDGVPGRNLQPLDAEAEAACARAGGAWNRGSIGSLFAQHGQR